MTCSSLFRHQKKYPSMMQYINLVIYTQFLIKLFKNRNPPNLYIVLINRHKRGKENVCILAVLKNN